jgi:superfamily II DNA helicase RecQ
VDSLLAVVAYCEEKVACRRQIFFQHFKQGETGSSGPVEKHQKSCRETLSENPSVSAVEVCDNCELMIGCGGSHSEEDCTEIGMKIVGVLREIAGGVSRRGYRGWGRPTLNQLKEILVGSSEPRYKEWSTLASFGCLKGPWMLETPLVQLLHRMITNRWIDESVELNNYNGYTGYCQVGFKAGMGKLIVLVPKRGGGGVDNFEFERAIRSAMTKSRPQVGTSAPVGIPSTSVTSPPDIWTLPADIRLELKGALNVIRSQIAKEEKAMPFEIFPDTTVLDLIDQLPKTIEDLEDIDKLNDRKIEMYGERILECIRMFLEEKGIVPPSWSQDKKVVVIHNEGADRAIRMVASAAQGNVTSQTATVYAKRFSSRKSFGSTNVSTTPVMKPESAPVHGIATASSYDDIGNLSEEAIIDLCTSPVLTQKSSSQQTSSSIHFEDISDEYIQWLKDEGAI